MDRNSVVVSTLGFTFGRSVIHI